MTTWYTKNSQALQYFIYFHYNEMGNEKNGVIKETYELQLLM